MRVEKEIYNKLQSDICIPKKVQQEVDSTLEQIAGERQGKQHTEKQRGSFSKAFRVVVACVAVAIIGMGGSVGAYSAWNDFADQHFGVTQENKEALQEEGVVNDTSLQVTQKGVTVECVKTIAAGKFAHALLKVTVPEGFDLRENMSFIGSDALRNGVSLDSWRMKVANDEEHETYFEKQMIDYEKGIFYMELMAETMPLERLDGEEAAEENPDLNWDGQILSLHLKDLGYITQECEQVVQLEGTWDLDIPMRASTAMRTCELNQTLKNGLTIHKFTLTPLSIYMEFSYKGGKYKKDPFISKYELKDGTVHSYEITRGIVNGEINDTKYYSEYGLSKVVDSENIVAVYINGDQRVELP